MYGGGASKRGGGRSSATKRTTTTTTPLSSSSFPRNRHATSSSSPAAAVAGGGGTEETMSLVREREDASLSFGMIVRLTPDLVGEIKRAEDHGGARIKFDSYGNNPSGNVIDVGGKTFRFTWSHETGNVCDIYEERRSGEDGDGLLVESGCAWRKLNVQRVLDESTKNHVKKRSEEAERQQKSRKAIILDNPSMKNQIKALAASESTSWRKPFQQKKEPEFKKRKIDPPPVASGGPANSLYKSGLPSNTTITSRASISPSPSQYGVPASPFFTGSMAKGHMSAEDIASNQAMMKENAITLEKEKFNKTSSSIVKEKPGRKGNFIANSVDLQSMLITLLKENPKGMSLKALEKAVGDSVPNSVKKIEPIIRKIASFRAPGRYILNPEVELGSSKKPLSESGSSPDDIGMQTPVVEEKQEDRSTPTPNFAQKTSDVELGKQAYLNLNLGEEMNTFGDVDIQHHSPDPYGEKRISENNEGPACSSSNSGSDSESDSSDSGSDSGSKGRSRSKSKSPVKSGSVSSSDSESDDVSSNSKQGPDEDVDIMTSDDEESKPKTQINEPKFANSPIPFRAFNTGPTQNGFEEKQDFNDSDMVEIEQDVPDDVHQTVVDSDRDPHPGYMFNGRENVANDVSESDRSRNPERTSKSKSKRGSESKPLHEKSGHSKRLKPGDLPQPQISRPADPIISESPQTISGNRVVEEAYKVRSSQVTNRALKDGSAEPGLKKRDNQGLSGKSSMDFQISGQRPSDPSRRARAFDTAEKSEILSESLDFGINNSGKNNQSQERLSLQKDRVILNSKDDTRVNKEKLRNSKESSFGEKPPVGVGRGKMLQRELSELELGEFREPSLEEKVGEKRLEKKNSFKEMENRPSSSDYWNSDFNKGRPTFRPGGLGNVEGPPKRTPENQTEDIARPPNRVLQSQPKVSLPPSRADRTEANSRKSGDTSGKIRHNEARENQENGVGGLGDGHTNVSVSASKQNDVERGHDSHLKKENKTRKMNAVKRRESSSDENSCSFSKYEKEEPELKGPVKDFSQYKEYVQEYREKYDSYCSLNKTLESYRNEFYKLGKDLESAKGRDLEKYYQIFGQLQESYRQCGNRHKRLKKIFVVLHEELKYLKQAIKDYAASYERE